MELSDVTTRSARRRNDDQIPIVKLTAMTRILIIASLWVCDIVLLRRLDGRSVLWHRMTIGLPCSFEVFKPYYQRSSASHLPKAIPGLVGSGKSFYTSTQTLAVIVMMALQFMQIR